MGGVFQNIPPPEVGAGGRMGNFAGGGSVVAARRVSCQRPVGAVRTFQGIDQRGRQTAVFAPGSAQAPSVDARIIGTRNIGLQPPPAGWTRHAIPATSGDGWLSPASTTQVEKATAVRPSSPWHSAKRRCQIPGGRTKRGFLPRSRKAILMLAEHEITWLLSSPWYNGGSEKGDKGCSYDNWTRPRNRSQGTVPIFAAPWILHRQPALSPRKWDCPPCTA